VDLVEIRADIAAFADSEDDIELGGGLLLFRRDRSIHECRITESDMGVNVESGGRILSYRRFLAEELGRLNIVAQALIEKRSDVNPYVDTQSITTDSSGAQTRKGSGLAALWQECQAKPVGETKLIFLTADAGQGKTALLRRLTRIFAEEYLAGKCDRVVFHIDTQGRSFVRLEEAVARDLGQLRISGLFYPGVLRLVRHGLMALAIDGFDELLAEIGPSEAYSGLGSLLRQLEGHGHIIASARSAYFEAENYAAQTSLLTSSKEASATVLQMRLERWLKHQTVMYFDLYRDPSGARIPDAEVLYDRLAANLGEDNPVLHRPFLVNRMAALIAPNVGIADELANDIGQSAIEVVPRVVQAMLKREVEVKWRDPAGQPYLTVDQHSDLLSAIADEMWTQGKALLPIETVQLITEAVMDDLKVSLSSRVQIAQRVKAHALLPLGSGGELSFDHEEFMNYFLAIRLSAAITLNDRHALQRFCEQRPLPDSVILWATSVKKWSGERAIAIVQWLSSICRDEVRSTYLKQNLGAISAQILRRFSGGEIFEFQMDSMYFEGPVWCGSKLTNGRFSGCTFLNVDLSGAEWKDCRLSGCSIDGMIIDKDTSLNGVNFALDCFVAGVLTRLEDGEERLKSYVPEDCRDQLRLAGAVFEGPAIPPRVHEPVAPDRRHALDAFLRIFSRSSGANEGVVKTKLGARYSTLRGQVLPLAVKHGVVREAKFSGGGTQERWELNYPIETIVRAEDPQANAPSNLRAFWEDLRS
jgi:hypothetical protein